MHPWSLELAILTASHEVKDVWAMAMLDLASASEQGHARAPLHVRITLLHDKVVETGHTTHIPARSSITSMVIPTTSYLRKIDPDGTMSLLDLKTAISEYAIKFEAMMASPVEFTATMSCEEIVELHDSFHLLQPLRTRWGRWVSWKCNCEGFFSAAVCADSLALSLLYDRTLTFPPASSTQKLPAREKNARRPSAWEKDKNEQEEAEENATRRQHWCPITTVDEMVLKSPSKKTKVIHSSLCSLAH